MFRQTKSETERDIQFINSESGAEIARQLRQDTLITQAMGGLFAERPDLSQVHSVLDVYCGAGNWAIEVAFTHSHIDVVGIDSGYNLIAFARTQAKLQGLDNVHFSQMSCTGSLPIPDHTFDIVNARFIASFISKEDWPRLIGELFRIVRPGGIIRLTECDEFGISNSIAHSKITKLFGKAMVRNGQGFQPESSNFCITPMLERLLREAGCQKIQEKPHIINYSVGREAHAGYYDNLKVAYKLGQPFLIRMGVVTQEELDELYEQMLMEMLSDDFRAIIYFLTVWGYKPEESSSNFR